MCDKMLNSELSQKEKIDLIKGILVDEFDRVGREGNQHADEAFKSELRELAKRWGIQFTDELGSSIS